MGNAMNLCRSRGGRRIRLMRMDGKVMRMEGPVYVKEIVEDYPNHGVFNARTIRLGLGLGRPLPENAELQASQLYYLIPLSRGDVESSTPISGAPSSSPEDADAERGSDGHVLRVKIRMSKQEMASFLSQYPLIKAMDAQTLCSNKLMGWKPTLSTISELNGPATPDAD